MGVDGVNQTSIPGKSSVEQIAVPLKPIDDKELEVIYKPLIDKMKANGMGDKVPGTIDELENLTDQLLKEFGRLDINRSDVRRWLSNTINKELKDPKDHPLNNTDDFSIRSWVKIGRRELYALVNVKRKNLGFFQRMSSALPSHDVTRAAFRELFCRQKDSVDGDVADKESEKAFHDLFHRKTVELDKFANTLKEEVFPFASSVSTDELSRTLRLFSARRFVMIDKDNMSDCVKTALFNLAKTNIEAEFPASNDDKIKGNEKTRNDLIAEVSSYILGKTDDKGNNIIDILGITENPPKELQEQGVTPKQLDQGSRAKTLQKYLVGNMNSVLFSTLHEAYFKDIASNKAVNVRDVFASAGLATLWGESGGLVNHLESEGLNEQTFNRKLANRYKHNDEATKNFISTMFIDWGMIKDGPKEWHGFPTVGPSKQPTNGAPLNTWAYWMLKNPKEVAGMKLDKPIVPPVPTKIAVPK
jgi:hypothetical protein